MASPFRSLSPALDRPKTAFTSPGNGNGLRKSFNVNVHPKAPAKNLSASTPVNSPADHPQRAPSPFKDSNSRQSEEIKENNENIRPHKSASLRSPTPKGMKSFMAPTFSAASKAAEPRKRILMEKNETVAHSTISMQSPAKTLAKSPSVPKPQISVLYEPMVEDSPHAREEREEVSVDCMEVDEVKSTPQHKSKACKLLFEAGVVPNPVEGRESNFESSEESESLTFLAQFPDPGDEPTVLPPYDPKTNYLSPRPQFLRYRPERDLELEVGEQSFGEHVFFESGQKSGLTEVTEIEGLQSLGEQMASVVISTDCGEIHDVEETEIASVDKSEEKPCNTGGAAFEPRLNVFEKEWTIYDDEDDEEEEKPSGWLRMSLLFVFVLLSASVALLGSGSPGLLPPSLHNNALATGKFYASTVNAVKDVEGFWRKGSVKDMNHSLLQYSRTKFDVIVENVKFWLGSSLTKLKMRTNSVMEGAMENSFDKTHSRGIEEIGNYLGLETIVERDIKDHSLPSDEGLLDVKESSTEATLKGFDQFLVSSVYNEQSTQIASAGEGDHVLEGNTKLEDDLHSAFENPSSSGMQEEGNKVGTHELGDFMPLSSPLKSESLPRLDIPVSSYSDIDEENDRHGREEGFEESVFSSSYRIDISASFEESLSVLHSEEADNINEHASEATHIDGNPEITVLPNPDQMFASVISKDSEVIEPFVLLVSQSNTEVKEESEALDMDNQTPENVTVEDESYTSSHSNIDGEYLVKEFQFTERTESMISQIEESALEESSSSAAKDFNGSGVDTSTLPKSSVRELLPSATIGLSILAATALAAIYFVSASRRNSKISSEVGGKSVKATKKPGDIYSPYSRVQFISTPQNRIEKRVNSRLSPPHVELLAEYFPAEMSSSDRASAYDNIAQTYERRSRRGNSISSLTEQEYAVTPDFSTDSPSYGSFTTYENIVRKEGGRDEEHKVMKVVTPVRRSSRIRKQAISPQ